MPVRSSSALGLTALVVGPLVLAAQQVPQPDSARRDTLRPYALPPVVVTATQVPTAQSKIGFATSVLDSRELAAEPTPLATRALTFLPGVSLDEGNGPGGPAVLHVRGGDEPFTQMMFDGVPVNISGGFNDIEGLMLTNVERVEIARGPLSALWGSSAMSGAVQFITREGRPGPTRFDLLAEGGGASHNNQQAHSELDASGGSERLRFSSGLGFSYDRGIYGLANDLRSGDWSLRLDAKPSERLRLTGSARYLDFQTNLPVRDQGVTRVPLDPNQRDGRHRWLGSVAADWVATPNWHHRVVVQLLWDDFTYRDRADGVIDSTAYPFISGDSGFVADFNLSYQSKLWRPALEYVGTNVLSLGRPEAKLTWSYGALWQDESEVDLQTGDFGNSRSAYGRSNEALFAEMQGQFGARVSVLGGARLEHYQGLPAQALPRGSVVVAVVPNWLALRAATGRAFLVPNLTNQFLSNPSYQPNPDLKPMSSVSWEVGATLTAPDRALTLSVGYFHQRNDDLIRTVPADTGTKVTNKNLGAAQSVGVEVELERSWSARWRMGLNVTWDKTKILDNAGLDPTDYPNGGWLPYVPSVTGSAFVSADPSRAVTAVARVTLLGDQAALTERFSGSRTTIGAHALLDLVAQWHVSQGFNVYTRLTNLLNTSYQAAFDKPGTPRAGVVGVRTRF